MELVIAGTGYVGLVTGTCLAEMGHHVTCVDIDAWKIDSLNRGVIPIYEPGLEELIGANVEAGRLFFSTSLADAMAEASVVFIAVGTPQREDGSANLDYVLGVAQEIGRNLNHYTVIADKSTVPVGTAERVTTVIARELEQRKMDVPFDVVSNPEFLKEGHAIEDFMKPDRIVVGASSERAARIMEHLYAPFNHRNDCIFHMGVRDAEMTKYAANALLATKISFMNEIASICDHMAVDVECVRWGIGSDSRIGYSFIYPGCGYGGSCFPKDVRALVNMAEAHGFEPQVLKAVESRNEAQKRVLFRKLSNYFDGALDTISVALWGLSFKPGTDDMREASAVSLVNELVTAGVRVRAHDPVAMDVARKTFPQSWFETGMLTLVDDQYEVLHGADALILATEWNAYRNPDFQHMNRVMRRPLILDGRNIYDYHMMRDFGFEYEGIGRSMKERGYIPSPLRAAV
ncbi:UDP-glucose dehydrogenase family protein [Pseudomonadota bacterium]